MVSRHLVGDQSKEWPACALPACALPACALPACALHADRSHADRLVVIAAQEDGKRIGRIRLQRVTDASARSLSPAACLCVWAARPENRNMYLPVRACLRAARKQARTQTGGLRQSRGYPYIFLRPVMSAILATGASITAVDSR